MKDIFILGIILIMVSIVGCYKTPTSNHVESDITVSAPLLTDSAGQTLNIAVNSVYRIICPSTNRMGTGFLYSSGKVLTAAHIINGSEPNSIFIITANKQKIEVDKVEKDQELDIALLYPKKEIKAKTFIISREDFWPAGRQVLTWGYPAGYNGLSPMLCVGWLSGEDVVKGPTGKPVNRFVVNAAFNAGNSGGPLIDVEKDEVIGIVASKMAPLPPYIESALEALKQNPSGFIYTKTRPDGTTEQMSEAQLLEELLQFLRSQTQLVVGHAIKSKDVREFLKNHRMEK